MQLNCEDLNPLQVLILNVSESYTENEFLLEFE